MSETQDPKVVPMHIQWHKICALLIFKMGGKQIITSGDTEAFAKKHPDGAILVHDQEDGLHLILVTRERAEELSAESPRNVDLTDASRGISGESEAGIGI